MNPDNYTLALGKYERYYVDLEDCTSSAEVLDWIAQIAGKAWATPEVLAGVVHAINDVLNPQATLCSGGSDKRMRKPAIRALVDKFAYAHPEALGPSDWDIYDEDGRMRHVADR